MPVVGGQWLRPTGAPVRAVSSGPSAARVGRSDAEAERPAWRCEPPPGPPADPGPSRLDEAKLIIPFRSAGGHRRYSRYRCPWPPVCRTQVSAYAGAATGHLC
ncbi:hypothetical protein GCM10029963_09820 [Micromonospora andamanensis]|nr:hypothetical protein Vwe01_10910 [Micromonospora andamanensis]